jgi:CRP-like cAMP-binding protein
MRKQTVPSNRRQAHMADLESFVLFDGLTSAEMSNVLPFLRLRILKKGMIVIEQGQTRSGLFLLQKGSVKVCLHDDEGKETILNICIAGEVLGEANAADGRGHTASVVTLEDSHFLWLSTADFSSCQQEFPQISRNLARMLAGRLRSATTNQEVSATLDLSGRVAHYLLLWANKHGVAMSPRSGHILLPVRITQSELAAKVGSKRECVNRILSHFKEKGYMSIAGNGKITLHDIAALQECCQSIPGRAFPESKGKPRQMKDSFSRDRSDITSMAMER